MERRSASTPAARKRTKHDLQVYFGLKNEFQWLSKCLHLVTTCGQFNDKHVYVSSGYQDGRKLNFTQGLRLCMNVYVCVCVCVWVNVIFFHQNLLHYHLDFIYDAWTHWVVYSIVLLVSIAEKFACLLVLSGSWKFSNLRWSPFFLNSFICAQTCRVFFWCLACLTFIHSLVSTCKSTFSLSLFLLLLLQSAYVTTMTNAVTGTANYKWTYIIKLYQ